jgi:hypothetical protein
VTGMNLGAPWQPGSGSLCSGENAGFVSFPIVEYLKLYGPGSQLSARFRPRVRISRPVPRGSSWPFCPGGCHEGFAMSSGCRDLPPKIWRRRNPQPRASQHRLGGQCPSYARPRCTEWARRW